DFDLFQEVSGKVGESVDHYQRDKELLKNRGSTSAHSHDACEPLLAGRDRFSDRIAYFTQKAMALQKSPLAFISEVYSLPSDQNQFVQTSLVSHAMCEVTADTLKKTIASDGVNRVPSSSVIAKANQLVQKYNALRSRMIKKDAQAVLEMNQFWSRVMMCLSYAQSLSSPDSHSSDKVAKKYAPKDYERPDGVLFDENRSLTGAQKVSLGLFQFSPDASGNVNPCLKQWNQNYSSCQISLDSSVSDQAEMTRILGSSYQTFNAFCGTQKPVQMFSVQINTQDPSKTHPINLNKDGTLKPAADRCVSLHFLPGNSYTPFGPLYNSTKRNLAPFLKCSLAQ
ncbi:MAG: hypothetical protein COT73_10445, partial [Bdellovibrio sp. CG10_big_fil_rev_8_21_14_0_10_47_8]